LGWRQTLWLADDHLLVVQDSLFAQTATRVDLRDIEAITQRPTATYTWTNALAAAPCLLGAGLLGVGDAPWSVFGACLLGACLPVLVANLLLGRTCACRLQTRVADRVLLALDRCSSARRTVALLSPLVLAAQADLPPVAAGLTALTSAGSTAAAPPPAPAAMVAQTSPGGP
jgi:hypothetical protein